MYVKVCGGERGAEGSTLCVSTDISLFKGGQLVEDAAVRELMSEFRHGLLLF